MKKIILLGLLFLLSGCSVVSIQPEVQKSIKIDQDTIQEIADIVSEQIKEDVVEPIFVEPVVVESVSLPVVPVQPAVQVNNIVEEVVQSVIKVKEQPVVTEVVKPPVVVKPVQIINVVEEFVQEIVTEEIESIILPSVETRYCCKYCKKGKACGDSCISRSYTCHKGVGCACDS